MATESKIDRPAAEELSLEISRLQAENEHRSQRYLRLGIVFSTVFITIVAAVFAFYQQSVGRAAIDSLLERQIVFRTAALTAQAAETARVSETVIKDIDKLRERFANIEVPAGSNLEKETQAKLASLSSQLSTIESELTKIREAKLIDKLAEIDRALEGDVMQLLSVPLLRSKLDAFRGGAEKELLKLEKSIDKLDARLNFFATTTVALILGLFTTVVAPLIISFMQSRAQQRAESSPSKQMQPTQ